MITVRGSYIFHKATEPACCNCKNWHRCEIKGSFGKCDKGLFRDKSWCNDPQLITTRFSDLCNEWETDGC